MLLYRRMQDIDFKELFIRAKKALETLDARIANIEDELEKAQNERKAAIQIYNAAAPLVDQPLLPTPNDLLLPAPGMDLIRTGGISVAVRSVLDFCWEDTFTPAEMRDKLAENGWDWKDYKNPLATVHTTLVRLVESEKAKPTTKDGKKAFYSPAREQNVADKVRKRQIVEAAAKAAMVGGNLVNASLKDLGGFGVWSKDVLSVATPDPIPNPVLAIASELKKKK